MGSEQAPLATVVVLTFNGDRYLRRLLQALLAQQVDGDVDVLVLDSGSTDGTLGIVADHPVRLHQIPNVEFQHGRTRNLAARLAQGTFVVYLTQDAIPIGPDWLAHMLAPLREHDDVAVVLGRQVPRPSCYPLLKREIRQVFGAQGSTDGVTLYRADGGNASAVAKFHSDVASATRRRLLLDEIPFREVEYAEDQLFCADVLAAGYAKAYAGQAAVEHSNDLTRAELARRTFDETVGLRRVGFDMRPLPTRALLRRVGSDVLHGIVDTLRDADYSVPRRAYWLAVNPVFILTKWLAFQRSAAVDLDDAVMISRGSLEAARRRAG